MAVYRYLSSKQDVLDAMGWGNSTHYEKINNELFVEPVKLGPRTSRYPSDEVTLMQDAYIAGKSKEEIRALVRKLHAARKGAL